MKKLYCFCFLLILLHYSCDKNEDVGYASDTIHLSSKMVHFSQESNKATITTKGSGWWFSSIIESNGEEISVVDHKQKIIEGEWFLVERVSDKEIKIMVSENNSNSKRQITINLQDGNYYDSVRVEQDE